mmetsp:Transcript_48318/g.119688  ORF Transcript_48318/g.119688 Transcript_48318/m.119688 type:complete len:440 (+) Transcript_48318:1257-2576(+)
MATAHRNAAAEVPLARGRQQGAGAGGRVEEARAAEEVCPRDGEAQREAVRVEGEGLVVPRVEEVGVGEGEVVLNAVDARGAAVGGASAGGPRDAAGGVGLHGGGEELDGAVLVEVERVALHEEPRPPHHLPVRVDPRPLRVRRRGGGGEHLGEQLAARHRPQPRVPPLEAERRLHRRLHAVVRLVERQAHRPHAQRHLHRRGGAVGDRARHLAARRQVGGRRDQRRARPPALLLDALLDLLRARARGVAALPVVARGDALPPRELVFPAVGGAAEAEAAVAAGGGARGADGARAAVGAVRPPLAVMRLVARAGVHPDAVVAVAVVLVRGDRRDLDFPHKPGDRGGIAVLPDLEPAGDDGGLKAERDSVFQCVAVERRPAAPLVHRAARGEVGRARRFHRVVCGVVPRAGVGEVCELPQGGAYRTQWDAVILERARHLER